MKVLVSEQDYAPHTCLSLVAVISSLRNNKGYFYSILLQNMQIKTEFDVSM